MLVVELLVVAAIVAAVVLVARGRSSALAPAPPDADGIGIDREGPLAADDVDKVRFGLAFRGFRALPGQLHFAVQRTPLARRHLRQGVEAPRRLVSALIAIRMLTAKYMHLRVVEPRDGVQQRTPKVNLRHFLRSLCNRPRP